MSQAAVELDYAQAVAYLVGRIDYERMLSVPYEIREYKLDRMRDLLARLGNPQDRLSIIHVAGTKGKGSTSAMIAGILSAAGQRTGLFTSPHLDAVEERLAIDGVPCPAVRLAELVRQLRPTVDAMDAEAAQQINETGPTYFELTTALAWMHFVSAGVDAAVLEVGMGGRLDSTNVCQPRLTVITSISYDHTRQLGETLAEIAGEKAGIVKPGVPLLSGVCDDEPRQVIAAVARSCGAPLIQLGTDFEFEYHARSNGSHGATSATLDFKHRRPAFKQPDSLAPWSLPDVELAMPGRHQAANAAVALAAIDQLRAGGWAISDEAVRRGLATTRCRGRIEIVSRRPTVVVDVAHNVASIDALLSVLDESFPPGRRRLIFATSRDKDVRGMLVRLLPAFDDVILTRYANNARGMTAEEVAEIAQDIIGQDTGAIRFRLAADSTAAWEAMAHSAEADDLIVATGSFFLAAEIRRLAIA